MALTQSNKAPGEKESRFSTMNGETWWLSGSAPYNCPAIQGSYQAFPQSKADYLSSGIVLYCAVVCPLRGVRKNYKNGKKAKYNICLNM
jgi:hypothetical protein